MTKTGTAVGLAVVRVLITAMAIVLGGWISLQFTYLPDRSSLVWLPAGIALGITYWWGYSVGLTGTALGIAYLVGDAWDKWDLALLSSIPCMMQAAVAVALLRAFRIQPSLSRWTNVLGFVLISALSAIISPLLNVLLRVQYGIVPETSWQLSVFHRWMGDTLGHLVMGSLLLVWWNNWRMHKREYALLSGLTLLSIASVWLAFYIARVGLVPGPSMLIALPAMVIATFALQQRGVTAMLFVTVLALADEVARWKVAQPLTLSEFMVGWLFLLVSFATFMTVSDPLTRQREYARRLEQLQQETERAYQQVRAILENAPNVAMQMYDTEGRVLLWNRASEQFYGVPAAEAIGKTLDQLIFSPEQQQEFMQTLREVVRTGQPAPLHEWRLRAPDGKEQFVLSAIFPVQFEGEVRVVCAGIDVTKLRALQQRLFYAEKMESIGRLAGGIAHDFNNLLTAILGFAEVAQSRLPHDHPAQRDLMRIIEASERAANLVRQLLGYARKQLTHPRPTALNETITALLSLLNHTINPNIRIRTQLTDDDTTVLIDPAQLEQVIMNLAINARDAMLPKGAGVLTIATMRTYIEPDQLPSTIDNEPIPPGEYVCLIVQDTGVGIPSELISRIFEPFFSTKGVGNSGLGLATVYGVVRQNNGFITVESEEGRGTTFRVCLPAFKAGHSQSQADAATLREG